MRIAGTRCTGLQGCMLFVQSGCLRSMCLRQIALGTAGWPPAAGAVMPGHVLCRHQVCMTRSQLTVQHPHNGSTEQPSAQATTQHGMSRHQPIEPVQQVECVAKHSQQLAVYEYGPYFDTAYTSCRRQGPSAKPVSVDQFACRAHFAAGQLISKLSSSYKGKGLVDAVLEAVDSIMRGVEIAAANPRWVATWLVELQ